MEIPVNWTDFKNIINANNLSILSLELSDKYVLSAQKDVFTLICIIQKPSDEQIDYENNYI